MQSDSALTNLLRYGSASTIPITHKYDLSQKVNDCASFYGTGNTGAVVFKHDRLVTGVHYEAKLSGKGYNPAHGWTAHIGFVPISSTAIGSSTTTQGLFANLLDYSGTLPFDSLKLAIDATDSVCIILGGLTSSWAATSVVWLDEVTPHNFNGTVASNINFRNGWTAGIFSDFSTIPNTIVTIPFLKTLNTNSALNGANLTAATVSSTALASNAVTTAKILDANVTPAKLSYTSTRSSAGTLTVAYGNDYTFTGTTSTWTLPAVAAGTTGRQNSIFIKNAGSGTITLNTNASANVLYYRSLTNTLSVLAGEAYIITPDGTQLNVYKCN